MNTQTDLARSVDRSVEQTRERPMVAPLVDIYENNDEILLVADVPGVTRDQVSIDLDKDRLTLLARRGNGSTDARRSGGPPVAPDYYRAFLVPQGIDAARIAAELSNGVLRVRLPK